MQSAARKTRLMSGWQSASGACIVVQHMIERSLIRNLLGYNHHPARRAGAGGGGGAGATRATERQTRMHTWALDMQLGEQKSSRPMRREQGAPARRNRCDGDRRRWYMSEADGRRGRSAPMMAATHLGRMAQPRVNLSSTAIGPMRTCAAGMQEWRLAGQSGQGR